VSKTLICFSVLLYLITLPVRGLSQTKTHHIYGVFTTGPAFTLGELGMKEVQKENSGFANTGFNVNMEVHIDMTKYIGLSMLTKQGTYAVDTRAYKEKLIYRNPTSDFSVQSDDWIIGGAFLGLYCNFFTNDSAKTKLMLKGYIGLMNGNTPYYLIKEKKADGTYLWTEQSMGSTEGNFAYVLAADFRYKIKPRLEIIISLDYLYTDQSFNHVPFTRSNGESGTVNIDMKYNSINSLIGIAYRFNKK